MTSIKKELKKNRPKNYYLKYPVQCDYFIALLLVTSHSYFSPRIGFYYIPAITEISDILNELISSTLSAAGFVLAAIAILASIKSDVEPLKSKRPKNGKQLFFYSNGYPDMIKIYAQTAVNFILLFIIFTVLRASVNFLHPSWLFHLSLIGVLVLILSFLRCILLLWNLINLQSVLNPKT